MRWLLAAATVVALALGVALAVRTFSPKTVAPSPSAAPAVCPDATARPAPALAEVSTAPLIVERGPGVVVRIDDAAPPESVREGRHRVTAEAPGVASATLELQVDAFTPVLLDARVSAGAAVTLVVVGARCATCANTGANPDLKYSPSFIGDLRAVAKGLAQGDWLEGAKAMKAIPPSEREQPEAIRLLAALYALAGRPSLVRAELELLPEGDATRKALQRRDALDELRPVRQLETATARWNAVTERFQRLGDGFVKEAHVPLSSLTQRFDALSKRFADAREAKDVFACEAALEEANSALADFVLALRARAPTDCAWQARVTAAL